MSVYLGTKLVKAVPMTLGDYNQLRGWKLPSEEDANKQGYVVEYLDGISEPNHPNYDNYISWSPKDAFDNSYQLTSGLNFGGALEAMRMGKAVARSSRMTGFFELRTDEYNTTPTFNYVANNITTVVHMRTDDVLATDWYILPEGE